MNLILFAAVITTPHRLVFVTDTPIAAESTDIAVYNEHVISEAGAAGLGEDWRAIVSTIDVDARDNTETMGVGVPIYLINGEKVADDYEDFWDGDLQAPISVTQFGQDNARFGGLVATGTQIDGTVHPVFPMAGDLGFTVTGSLSNIDVLWVDGFSSLNSTELPLYAMSGVRAAEVPEPSGLMLLGCLAFCLFVSGVIRKLLGDLDPCH